jgi:tellurite resistance protein TerC
MWTIFGITVIALLFIDLFVFNRKNEVPCLSKTLWICIFYFAAGLVFGIYVIYERGLDLGMLYFTGFLVEKSLSLDNVFVMSMIFVTFNVPREYQHRVLFWGVLGAIVLRAIFITIGEALVTNFEWVLYLFSLFLVYTGVQMYRHKNDANASIEDTKIYKFVSKFFRTTPKIENDKFWVRHKGKLYMTPLFLALVMIEIMDVIFALDSIPAIFLITTDLFVVYTSNIFAILGLRALYFLLEAAINKFRYLKPAVSIVLIFIGVKIFVPHIGIDIQPWMELSITLGLLSGGVILSLLHKEPVAKGKKKNSSRKKKAC